jgi:hypothetical protein
MGSHNFIICNEQLAISNYTKDGLIFFSISSIFSNARINKPWRKHKKPKVFEMKKKLQVDKSKAKEETNENAVAPKNWNDQWHVAKLICRGWTREFIIWPKRGGIFLNSFWQKETTILSRICSFLVETICF